MPNASARLFSPLHIKEVTLRNRIGVPRMCQYSAVDGLINDWHTAHLTGLARGGAGLVVVEATAVAAEGRISPGCTGLWNDVQAEAFAPVIASIDKAGAVPGIQIAHAGRKASANRPWEGDDHMAEGDPRAWPTIWPSPVAFGANLPRVPREMTVDDIQRVKSDFVAGAIGLYEQAMDVRHRAGSGLFLRGVADPVGGGGGFPGPGDVAGDAIVAGGGNGRRGEGAWNVAVDAGFRAADEGTTARAVAG